MRTTVHRKTVPISSIAVPLSLGCSIKSGRSITLFSEVGQSIGQISSILSASSDKWL